MANTPIISKTSDDNSNIDFTKTSQVLDSLLSIFKIPSAPAPSITKVQALSAKLRPGLCPTKMAAEVIKRQSEAGAPVGSMDDGTENVSEKMERIRMEVIVECIIRDARITTTTLPGQTVQVSGANAGGPIVAIGRTLTLGSSTGIIQ